MRLTKANGRHGAARPALSRLNFESLRIDFPPIGVDRFNHQEKAIMTVTTLENTNRAIVPPAQESTGVRQPRILCIDDDPDITHAVELALGNLNVDLTCAFDGQQGIWQSIESKPDLILTDWLMPNGCGEDVVSTLKRNRSTRSIPIVVLSCLGGDKLKQRLKMMGVAGFVQKPVSYISLLKEVSRHVDIAPTGYASTTSLE